MYPLLTLQQGSQCTTIHIEEARQPGAASAIANTSRESARRSWDHGPSKINYGPPVELRAREITGTLAATGRRVVRNNPEQPEGREQPPQQKSGRGSRREGSNWATRWGAGRWAVARADCRWGAGSRLAPRLLPAGTQFPLLLYAECSSFPSTHGEGSLKSTKPAVI